MQCIRQKDLSSITSQNLGGKKKNEGGKEDISSLFLHMFWASFGSKWSFKIKSPGCKLSPLFKLHFGLSKHTFQYAYLVTICVSSTLNQISWCSALHWRSSAKRKSFSGKWESHQLACFHKTLQRWSREEAISMTDLLNCSQSTKHGSLLILKYSKITVRRT